jgi:hypothetical protein
VSRENRPGRGGNSHERVKKNRTLGEKKNRGKETADLGGGEIELGGEESGMRENRP